jgi:hypothetical protein
MDEFRTLFFFFSNIKFKSKKECAYCGCDVVYCNVVLTNATAPNDVYLT